MLSAQGLEPRSSGLRAGSSQACLGLGVRVVEDADSVFMELFRDFLVFKIQKTRPFWAPVPQDSIPDMSPLYTGWERSCLCCHLSRCLDCHLSYSKTLLLDMHVSSKSGTMRCAGRTCVPAKWQRGLNTGTPRRGSRLFSKHRPRQAPHLPRCLDVGRRSGPAADFSPAAPESTPTQLLREGWGRSLPSQARGDYNGPISQPSVS